MSGGTIDRAKNGEPLRARHDLRNATGVRNALREIYPPDEAAEASFDQLLGQLSNERGCNVPTQFNGGSHASH